MPSVFCVQKRIYVVKNRLHRPEASPERRGEPPNGGGGVCRTHGRGFRTLRRAGMLPLRAAGAQEGRQPAVFHPLVNHPFSRKGLGADGRLRKHEKGERQSGYRSVGADQCVCPFLYLYAMSDTFLLHIRFSLRRRGTVMPRVAAIPAAVYGKTLRPEAVNRLRGSDAPKNRCRNPSVAASCASSPFRGACNRPEGANRFAFYSFAAI